MSIIDKSTTFTFRLSNSFYHGVQFFASFQAFAVAWRKYTLQLHVSKSNLVSSIWTQTFTTHLNLLKGTTLGSGPYTTLNSSYPRFNKT